MTEEPADGSSTRPATLVIRGGTVVERRRAAAGPTCVVADGRVVAVGPTLEVPTGATVLDAGGCLVGPGLVDLHTHLRQPGREEAETVETGARAAALGGYTAVVAMPNTEPAIDSVGTAREVLELGRPALAEVAVAGAITVGRAGERLAPMAELAALGRPAVHRRRGRGPGRRAHAPGPRLRPRPRGDPGPALRGRRAWPPAGPCTRGRGRAGWASRASRRRPRRPWWPGTSPWSG